RPDKKKIISRVKGYHGVTIVSGSLTGLPYNHMDFDLPVDRILHTTCPHHWKEGHEGETEAEFTARLAQDLRALIDREGPHTIAAMIAEPVMGAGGVIVPPAGYFEAIQPVLDEHEIALISDEVITGFGRTGNWFGAQTLGMRPAAMSMAKQMTGGYAPLSAVAMSTEIAEAIEGNTGKLGNFGHGFTYGGHPLGCAVGVKALEIYQRRDIPGHVRSVTPTFERLIAKAAEHPLVGEGRSCGLMGCLELAPPGAHGFKAPGKVGAKMASELLERGVILRAIGDVMAICPPMIITEAEIEEMFAPVEASLDATMVWARAQGHMQ
ncbi:MAG: aminotransferase class III-fold pyridoxal phosphate-dependent enzyme, partial [Pseudomonadota bacterium]